MVFLADTHTALAEDTQVVIALEERIFPLHRQHAVSDGILAFGHVKPIGKNL